MGISASVGLTVLLFNIGFGVVMDVTEDVTVIREDVAYIKGKIEAWDANYENPRIEITELSPSVLDQLDIFP